MIFMEISSQTLSFVTRTIIHLEKLTTELKVYLHLDLKETGQQSKCDTKEDVCRWINVDDMYFIFLSENIYVSQEHDGFYLIDSLL